MGWLSIPLSQLELEPTEDQYCKNTAEFCFNSAAHSLRRGDKAMAEQWLGAAQVCVGRMETDGPEQTFPKANVILPVL